MEPLQDATDAIGTSVKLLVAINAARPGFAFDADPQVDGYDQPSRLIEGSLIQAVDVKTPIVDVHVVVSITRAPTELTKISPEL